MKGGMRGGGGQMGNLLKQAQKMQKQMVKAQEELEEMEVEATSGGGMVTVVANCKNEIVDIEIKPEAVDPEDIEMLEDLVISAVNEAMRKASETASEHMGKITGPMQGMLPPGMGF